MFLYDRQNITNDISERVRARFNECSWQTLSYQTRLQKLHMLLGSTNIWSDLNQKNTVTSHTCSPESITDTQDLGHLNRNSQSPFNILYTFISNHSHREDKTRIQAPRYFVRFMKLWSYPENVKHYSDLCCRFSTVDARHTEHQTIIDVFCF